MGEVIKRASGWYIRYYDSDGKRRIKATGVGSHAEARRRLLRVEAEIAGGARSPGEQAEALTVAELCDRFLASSHPAAKDPERYRRQVRFGLRPVLPLIGHILLGKLKRRDLEAVRDKLSAEHKANSVRFYLAPLGAALSWAVRQELLTSSPMAKLKMPRRHNSTDRLTAEQASRLLGVAKERAVACAGKKRALHYSLYIMLELALRLGLRKGECFGLRWSDLDFKKGWLTVARQLADSQDATAAGEHRLPKSGKARTLPMSSELATELLAWRAECPPTPAGLVCPLGSTAIGAINELLEAAGCPRFTRPLHSLRHTFASLLVENGGSLLAVKELLGHSSLDMTLVYSHLAPSALVADVAKIKL